MISIKDLPDPGPNDLAELEDKLLTPLELPGGISLQNRLALAPMAGTTSKAFRLLAAKFGAGLVVTELISARGLIQKGGFERARTYLAIDPEETVAIQLFGSEPEDFAQAIPLILQSPEYQAAVLIDLNLGCPVPKVVKSGAGSALLLDQDRASRIIEAAVKAARPYQRGVSVKLRTGWADESGSCESMIRRAIEAGACLVCLHGRTRQEFYSGQADWQRIAQVGGILADQGGSGAYFYGNGDISCPADVYKALSLKGLDGVMVGRAAQGAPWIFQTLRGLPEPTKAEKLDLIYQHFELLASELGQDQAVREFRGQLMAYCKGFPGASQLRARAGKFSAESDLRELLGSFYN